MLGSPAQRRKAIATRKAGNKLSFRFLSNQGERAYETGARPEDCPFDPASDEADAWLFGWESGRDAS